MERSENGKIKRPNNGKDKQDALEQFPLIIEFVAPQRILIASAWVVESIQELFDGGGYNYIEEDIWKMTFKGIPIIGINHPKVPGYSLEQARKATARLCNISQ